MKPTLPIAVVIPAYQAARDLPGAIATVRAQTVDVAEIVVVDDGSDDDGAAIAEALGATAIRQANAGAGPARNAGIRHARAPWIALLDADDRWEPAKLERQWLARSYDPAVRLIATDYAQYAGDRLRCASSLAEWPNYAGTPKTRLAPGVVEISAAALARTLPAGQFLAPSTILVERALVLDGTFFAATPSLPLHHVSEDIEWYLRALRRTDAIVVERPLMRYAIGGPSLSSNAGRMHYGVVVLGRMVAAEPERYVAGSVAGFARDRVRRESLTVRGYLRALDTERALAALADFRAERRSFELDLLGVAARLATLPVLRPVLRALRTLWRARPR